MSMKETAATTGAETLRMFLRTGEQTPVSCLCNCLLEIKNSKHKEIIWVREQDSAL